MNDCATDTPARAGTSPLRVGLMLGGIVLAAVVIFGLGVMEGSRVVESVPAAAAPPTALPTETIRPVAPAASTSPDKLTFYDRLSGVAPAPPLALPETPPPVQALTPAPAPPVPAAPVQAAPAQQSNAKPPPPTAVAVPKKAPAPAPPKADPAARIKKLTGKGRFTVQMGAVSDRAAAAETAALIKRHGFEAVTVMASVKGKILYRIRVGSFPSKQAAAEAAEIFRSAYGLNGIPVEN